MDTLEVVGEEEEEEEGDILNTMTIVMEEEVEEVEEVSTTPEGNPSEKTTIIEIGLDLDPDRLLLPPITIVMIAEVTSLVGEETITSHRLPPARPATTIIPNRAAAVTPIIIRDRDPRDLITTDMITLTVRDMEEEEEEDKIIIIIIIDLNMEITIIIMTTEIEEGSEGEEEEVEAGSTSLLVEEVATSTETTITRNLNLANVVLIYLSYHDLSSYCHLIIK